MQLALYRLYRRDLFSYQPLGLLRCATCKLRLAASCGIGLRSRIRPGMSGLIQTCQMHSVLRIGKVRIIKPKPLRNMDFIERYLWGSGLTGCFMAITKFRVQTQSKKTTSFCADTALDLRSSSPSRTPCQAPGITRTGCGLSLFCSNSF